MTSGSVLPLDITVYVTSSLESRATANPQMPYDISVTVTTSSLVTIPFINVGATSSQGTSVVVSALEPYNLNVYPTESAGNVVIPSDVLPYTVAVMATSSYNTFVVPSPQGTPQFAVSTTAEINAISASYAMWAINSRYAETASFVSHSYTTDWALSASHAKQSDAAQAAFSAVTASYAIAAASVAGVYESASFALTASYAQNVPAGIVSSSVQINTGSFSGSFIGSLLGTASYAISSSHAETASLAENIVVIHAGQYTAGSSVILSPLSASWVPSASYAVSASWAPVGLLSFDQTIVRAYTGSFTGSITGTLAGTSSYAVSASRSVSASYAQTASYVATASYAPTASYVLSNKDIDLPVCSNQPANTVIKAISSQLNEPDTSDRFQFDLSTYSQYRVTSQVIRAGPSGSKVGVQYSTDQSNWHYLDTTSGSLLSVTSTGIRTTNWFNLDVSSRSDVFIRWVACNGDDLSDMSFRYISLGVR